MVWRRIHHSSYQFRQRRNTKKVDYNKKELKEKYFGKEKIKVSASFGAASVFDEKRRKKWIFDLKKLIEEADIEMYKNKKISH